MYKIFAANESNTFTRVEMIGTNKILIQQGLSGDYLNVWNPKNPCNKMQSFGS